jgi:hypothetical protein
MSGHYLFILRYESTINLPSCYTVDINTVVKSRREAKENFRDTKNVENRCQICVKDI